MSEPTFSTFTERMYARLPETFREADRVNDWALKRYLSAIGDIQDQAEKLIARFTYLDPEERSRLSDLVEDHSYYEIPWSEFQTTDSKVAAVLASTETPSYLRTLERYRVVPNSVVYLGSVFRTNVVDSGNIFGLRVWYYDSGMNAIEHRDLTQASGASGPQWMAVDTADTVPQNAYYMAISPYAYVLGDVESRVWIDDVYVKSNYAVVSTNNLVSGGHTFDLRAEDEHIAFGDFDFVYDFADTNWDTEGDVSIEDFEATTTTEAQAYRYWLTFRVEDSEERPYARQIIEDVVPNSTYTFSTLMIREPGIPDEAIVRLTITPDTGGPSVFTFPMTDYPAGEPQILRTTWNSPDVVNSAIISLDYSSPSGTALGRTNLVTDPSFESGIGPWHYYGLSTVGDASMQTLVDAVKNAFGKDPEISTTEPTDTTIPWIQTWRTTNRINLFTGLGPVARTNLIKNPIGPRSTDASLWRSNSTAMHRAITDNGRNVLELAASNRIVNPSFESGLEGWYPTTNGTVVTDRGRTGTRSWKADKEIIGRAIPVKPGEVWRWVAYFWVEGTPAPSEQGGLRPQYSMDGGQTWTQLSVNVDPALAGSWQKLTYEVTLPAGVTHVRMRIAFTPMTGWNCWVDDAALYPPVLAESNYTDTLLYGGQPIYVDPTEVTYVAVGDKFTFSADVRTSYDLAGIRVFIGAYGGTVLDRVIDMRDQKASDGWVRYTGTATVTEAPAGAYVRAFVWPSGDVPPGTVLYVRNIALEKRGDGLNLPFFDGDNFGAKWTGTAHASTSTADAQHWRHVETGLYPDGVWRDATSLRALADSTGPTPSSVRASEGSNSLQVTVIHPTGAWTYLHEVAGGTSSNPVIPGQTVTVGYDLWEDYTSTSTLINWYKVDGSYLADGLTNHTVIPNQWNRLTTTFVAPAGAYYFRTYIARRQRTRTGTSYAQYPKFWVDAVTVETGDQATSGEYFDETTYQTQTMRLNDVSVVRYQPRVDRLPIGTEPSSAQTHEEAEQNLLHDGDVTKSDHWVRYPLGGDPSYDELPAGPPDQTPGISYLERHWRETRPGNTYVVSGEYYTTDPNSYLDISTWFQMDGKGWGQDLEHRISPTAQGSWIRFTREITIPASATEFKMNLDVKRSSTGEYRLRNLALSSPVDRQWMTAGSRPFEFAALASRPLTFLRSGDLIHYSARLMSTGEPGGGFYGIRIYSGEAEIVHETLINTNDRVNEQVPITGSFLVPSDPIELRAVFFVADPTPYRQAAYFISDVEVRHSIQERVNEPVNMVQNSGFEAAQPFTGWELLTRHEQTRYNLLANTARNDPAEPNSWSASRGTSVKHDGFTRYTAEVSLDSWHYSLYSWHKTDLVSVGQTLYFSARARASTQQIRLQVYVYDSNNSIIQTFSNSTFEVDKYRFTTTPAVEFVIPPNTYRVAAIFTLGGDKQVGSTMDFTDAMITNIPGPFFYRYTPDDLLITNTWDATNGVHVQNLVDYRVPLNAPNLLMTDSGYNEEDVPDRPEDVPLGATSDLVDPRTANTEWLSWLAQFAGEDIYTFGSMQDFRAAISDTSTSFASGTIASIRSAIQTVLMGTKTVRVFPHTNDPTKPGEAEEWDLTIVTRTSESPSIETMEEALRLRGVKPAGVTVHFFKHQATWDAVELDNPTWNVWDTRTWTGIEESGLGSGGA
jgi:hypothetical protein